MFMKTFLTKFPTCRQNRAVVSSFQHQFCAASSSTNNTVLNFDTLSNIVSNSSISSSVCDHHGHDESYHRIHSPSAVVWPDSVAQVQSVAKYCYENEIAMIPYGTGTGLEGGVVPLVSDAVCVNLSNMNKILDIDVENFTARVESGVTRLQLAHELSGTGLWFPVDPGADASLCGMAATSASGTNAVRYGTMKENVYNLQVVLSDGRVINTSGGRTGVRKSSAGYNLTELFVGSEGTLGFITSAVLKLHALPETTLTAICSFPSIPDAVNTAVQTLQSSIPVAKMELIDKHGILATNSYSKLNHKPAPSLFFEFHGSANSAQEQAEIVSEIAAFNNGSHFKWAEKQEEKNKLWKARHNMLYAVLATRPGSKGYMTDCCVPLPALADSIEFADDLLSKSSLSYSILGHVGDGNFHCTVCVENEDDRAKLVDISHQLAHKAISFGGTCTGEHGIGIGKRLLLPHEIGDVNIALLKQIKQVFDPLNLMNPGKIFCD